MRYLKLLFISLLPLSSWAQNIYTFLPYHNPSQVVIEGGTAYVSANDTEPNPYPVIRKIDLATADTSIYAGTNTTGFSGDGGLATSAQISTPSSLAIDKHGNLLFYDAGNFRIRKVDKATGIINTIAGNGIGVNPTVGANALSTSLPPNGRIALDTSDNIYVTRAGGGYIWKIDAITNVITLAAGIGSTGYSGDGGPALLAETGPIKSICIDKQNNLYFATQIYVRKIAPDGILTTIAGNNYPYCSGGNSGPNRALVIGSIALDNNGDIFIIQNECGHILRFDLSANMLYDIAGIGMGYDGDGGPAEDARFLIYMGGLAVDSCSNLYICDNGNKRIRRINFAPSCFPLGVNEVEANPHAFTLSPNPASSIVTVSATEEITSMLIYDITGRVVLRKIAKNRNVNVDVSGLCKGVYLVKVNGTRVERLVVQ